MVAWRLRLALLGGYLVLVLVTGAALWGFAQEVSRHLGADHTAAASDIVRGQHQTATLRRAAVALREAPSRFHQQRMLTALDTIENQSRTLRHALPRLGLEAEPVAEARANLEAALARLPELRLLTRRVLEAPERLGDFTTLAERVEGDLAFVYSSLHARNHEAAHAQRRLTGMLSVAVTGLAAILLIIIAALLWAVDGVLRQRAALERLTVTDALTRLPNRRALLQRADWVLAQHRRNGRPVSLALIDIDHFKRVNDLDGHPAGDRVLRALGERLNGAVRAVDMVARLGGEEFGLLMPETDAVTARHLCERVRAHIATSAGALTPRADTLTVSIGMATSTPGTETSFDGLYARADRALYAAKRQGRNRVVATGAPAAEPDADGGAHPEPAG